jgi:hypothetical protein
MGREIQRKREGEREREGEKGRGKSEINFQEGQK